MAALKKYERLPVHIVEGHNDALEPIFRSIATKHLNYNDNLMIHFDSHPDLVIPRKLRKEEVFNKEVMQSKLTIENWIMPAVFAGHFNKIVWIKPPWSNQIEDGEYHFCIGLEKDTGFVRVSSELLYFVSEISYCSKEEMEEVREVSLYVITLGDKSMVNNLFSEISSIPSKSASELETQGSKDEKAVNDSNIKTVQKLIEQYNGVYVLDVDLDFFSTLNPFIDMHKDVHMYEKLSKIYHFELEFSDKETVLDNQDRREYQIDTLGQFFDGLQAIISPSPIRGETLDTMVKETPLETQKLLEELVLNLLGSTEDDIDWGLVHDAGCTWDSWSQTLPHHPSTDDQIKALIDCTKTFLDYMPAPTLVTLARSSLDEYCPPDKVDSIQEMMCGYLKSKYETMQRFYHY